MNLMTAGRGITHSRASPAASAPQGPRAVAASRPGSRLPTAKEEIDPAFEHVAGDGAAGDRRMAAPRARVIMGSLWGATSPVTQHSPTIYADIALAARRRDRRSTTRPRSARFTSPRAKRASTACALEPATLYVLRPGIRATLRSERGAHVMLCGGAALDGPRHVFWNFVSSRRDRINQAKEDWRAGRFALPPDDDDEFIPLPEVPKTVSYP